MPPKKALQIPVFTMQRDDFGDRHIAVTDDKLFAARTRWRNELDDPLTPQFSPYPHGYCSHIS